MMPCARSHRSSWIAVVLLAGLGCSSRPDHGVTGSGGSGSSQDVRAGAGSGAKSASGSGGAGGAGSGGGGGGSGTQGGGGASAGSGSSSGAGGAGGASGGGTDAGTAVTSDDLIAAPDGKDSAAGRLDAPTTLTSAITRIAAGHTIYLRGGTYGYSVQVTIARDNSGTDGQRKQIAPYAGEKPLLDFSSQPYGTGSNPRGLQIEGSYWHVTGLTVTGSADNGIYVAGNHNIIEGCIVHGNRDTGLQLGRYASSATQMADWPSDNLILNCESYDNYDAPPGSGENADGFAAKLTVGPGNVFRGCVSHNNIDDGWDLYTKTDTGAIGGVTIDQCIAHHNGTLTNGTTNANGDRNGFKLGGEKIAVAHVVTRSIAFKNGKNGFTWNSNPGAIRLSNNLAFDNVEGNFKFGDSGTTTQAVFTNNASFWMATSGAQSDKTVGTDVSNSNCWWDTGKTPQSQNGKGLAVSATDFASSLASPAIARNADGSLDFSPFALSASSDLLDAGVVPSPAASLPFDATYYRGNPDLGAVESR
jgi:hypothetical protein